MAYTQDDIDKIIACREAVDKHRTFNQVRQDVITSSFSIQQAKQSLYTTLNPIKTGKGGLILAPLPAPDFPVFSDASASKEEIKDALEEERTQSTLEMNKVLIDNGFVDENGNANYIIFKKFNNEICFEIYKGCRPGIGFCDWCSLDELKEQECIKQYGLQSCTMRVKGALPDFGAYVAGFDRHSKGMTEIINGFECAISVCPKGHGYHMDIDNLKEFPFDIFNWGV